MGATVLLHGRENGTQRCKRFMQQLEITNWNIIWRISSLASVRRLAAEVQAKHNHLNVLINNAGIGAGNCKDSLGP